WLRCSARQRFNSLFNLATSLVCALIWRSFAAIAAVSVGMIFPLATFARARSSCAALIALGYTTAGWLGTTPLAAEVAASFFETIAPPSAVPALIPIKLNTVLLIVSVSPRPVMIQRK